MAGLIISGKDACCPRCGNAFSCTPEAIATCGCFGIVLTESQQDCIRRQYVGCLCRACLLALQQGLAEEVLPEPVVSGKDK